MNPDGDDDFLTNLQMDDANMMLVDDFLEYVKNEPDLDNIDIEKLTNDAVNINFNKFTGNANIKSEQNQGDLSPTSVTSSTTINGIPDSIIDPNEFFHDMYKSEIDYSSTISSPSYRNTPSPTTSNSSQSSLSDHVMDYNSSSSNQSDVSANVYTQQSIQTIPQVLQSFTPNYHLDTPPISPPTDNIAMTNVQAISYMQQLQSITQPIPVINNIIQGTLIPITAVSLPATHNVVNNTSIQAAQTKKVKIQPKPIAIATKPIASSIIQSTPTTLNNNTTAATTLNEKSNATPKRIVLSENDYKALVQKCKSQQNAAGPTVVDKKILKIVTAAPAQTNNTKLPTINGQTTIQLNSTATAATPVPATTTTTTTPLSPVTVQNNRIQITQINHSTAKPKPKTIQDEIDERTMKKQMRMIKNRESACLSRKKKKEYVTTLEARLMDLSKENQDLKSENSALKDRLSQMASKICDICGNLMTDKTVKSCESPVLTFKSVPKKNAAFLLAFIIMVSVNVGPYISPRTPDFATFSGGDKSLSLPQHHTSRGLLWIDDTDTGNTSTIDNSETNEKLYPMCPVSVNQTESIRLATELQRWIGDLPEYFNLTKLSLKLKNNIDLKNINEYLLPNTDDATIKTIYKQMRKTGTEQNGFGERLPEKDRRPAAMAKHRRKAHATAQKSEIYKTKSLTLNGGSVQIYNPVYSNAIKYATFFEEIHRQNDTFYVVSFRGDHLLLPALAHNNAFRPKMSLMLPAFGHVNGTADGTVTLMQIDCEVVNTSMIQIKESSIPDELKNHSTNSMPTKHSSTNSMPMANEPINLPQPRVKSQTTTATDEDALTQTHNDNNNNIKNATNLDNKRQNAAASLSNIDDDLNKYKPYFLNKKSEKPTN